MFKFALFVLLVAVSTTSTAAQARVGDLFNFIPSLGACGFTNTSQQIVASVPSAVFSSYPGAGTNPNKNPICHHSVQIESGQTTLTAPIVDFYTAATDSNVGLSAAGFVKFADLDDGVVRNVSWVVV
ncbi:hypothetical protein CPB84DRAFT_908295 [Gymnopilus junonius]|uniref:Uncharacterized protein n=1 Tax=Gymnopilus junonius TaxID=109634 RepID=A0A9P5NP70_GYMJU|nr:hypothetical protein CPB84DRAFT_908295 [Gymnopilus junonius]